MRLEDFKVLNIKDGKEGELVNGREQAIGYFKKQMKKTIDDYENEFYSKYYYYDLAIEALKESKMLVLQSNSYRQIERFFYNDKRIKPFYEEAQRECIECGNVGMATIMITTIQNLLDELE